MSNFASPDIYNHALFKQAYWANLRAHIDQLIKHQAVVGLFGKCETGKSTLCHALLGRDIDQQNTIDLNTTSPQEFTLAYKNGKGLALIDMPGFGHATRCDQGVHACYESILPEVDLVLWVIRADDPDLHVDLAFYQRTVVAYCQQRDLPVLLVCNEFKQSANDCANSLLQGGQQAFFGYSNAACVVSAQMGNGIYCLVEQILAFLPQQRQR